MIEKLTNLIKIQKYAIQDDFIINKNDILFNNIEHALVLSFECD